MEQAQYLIDTNAVIDYLGQKLPISGMAFMHQVIDTSPYVSVITKIEVLGFNAPAQYYQLLTNFMDDITVLGLTGEVAARRFASCQSTCAMKNSYRLSASPQKTVVQQL